MTQEGERSAVLQEAALCGDLRGALIDQRFTEQTAEDLVRLWYAGRLAIDLPEEESDEV